jgi:hypothetical protein
MVITYNQYHLGDNLIHLNYLRRLGIPAVHHCHPMYHKELAPLVEGTEITLGGTEVTAGAVDAWINTGNFLVSHPDKKDWVKFHFAWFDRLSEKLRVDNPIKTVDDFLFDYPALNKQVYPHFDYLIINAPPNSGQLPDFNYEFFKAKAQELLDQGFTVATTHPTDIRYSTMDLGMSVSDIGNLSKYVSHIISVDTGPLWPTFNVHNKETVKTRIVYGTTSTKMDITPNVFCRESLK